MYKRYKFREEGFSILEVLVSITLISLIVVPLMGSYSNLFSASDRIINQRQAVNLAQNAADEFIYLYQKNDSKLDNKIKYWNEGDWKEEYGFDNDDEYKVEIKSEKPLSDFRLIRIKVLWGNSYHNLEFETLIKDPDTDGG